MSNQGDIVIVDDNPNNLTLLAGILREAGFRVRVAKSGVQAIEQITFQLPELVMLDIKMPEMDGYEVCRRLKADDKLRAVPVIFISALDDTDDKVRGFALGAVDYVVKPFQAAEVLARAAAQIEIYRLRRELESRNHELKTVNEKLELASRTDLLTALANRRAFVEQAEHEIERFRRSGRIFSIVLADIDFFKKINDTYGHAGGDFVLRKVADALSSNVRKQDLVARWGGEEFILLLPETNSAGAFVIAEKIRSLLNDTVFDFESHQIRLSMTFGVAEFDKQSSLNDSIARADAALYQGKAAGRNRVVTTI